MKVLEEEVHEIYSQQHRVGATDSSEQGEVDAVPARYTRKAVQKPQQHDEIWRAQAADCAASQTTSVHTLGQLALKYGLGTQYDPFTTAPGFTDEISDVETTEEVPHRM